MNNVFLQGHLQELIVFVHQPQPPGFWNHVSPYILKQAHGVGSNCIGCIQLSLVYIQISLVCSDDDDLEPTQY